MKKNTFKKLFFFISISFFCVSAFAQGPTDPGNDPLISSNQLNEQIHMPEQKIAEKNVEQQYYFLPNIGESHEALQQRIYFSNFSLKKYKQKSKAKIIFSNTPEDETRVKPTFQLVTFNLNQI